MYNDTRSLRACGSTSLILAVACALGVSAVPPAHAQSLPPSQLPPSLDTVMVNLLSNNCAGLRFDGADPLWGPNLSAICDFARIPHEAEHERARAHGLGVEPGRS